MTVGREVSVALFEISAPPGMKGDPLAVTYWAPMFSFGEFR